jgi:hypothetical protein
MDIWSSILQLKTEQLRHFNTEYNILHLKTEAARKANDANLRQCHHQFTRMGFGKKKLEWLD